mmetsp:Transcript_4990/g.7554  ORF Transcript_4990/g.7554 Transcript_4990/m.7554 type:complete len:131 (+) Transcript_4990:7-399(+)
MASTVTSSSSSSFTKHLSSLNWKKPNLTKDPTSFSNIDQVQTFHIHLDLSPNFETSQFTGSVELSFLVVGENTKTIVLDINKLDIKNVYFGVHFNFEPLEFFIDKKRQYTWTSVNYSTFSSWRKGCIQTS